MRPMHTPDLPEPEEVLSLAWVIAEARIANIDRQDTRVEEARPSRSLPWSSSPPRSAPRASGARRTDMSVVMGPIKGVSDEDPRWAWDSADPRKRLFRDGDWVVMVCYDGPDEPSHAYVECIGVDVYVNQGHLIVEDSVESSVDIPLDVLRVILELVDRDTEVK